MKPIRFSPRNMNRFVETLSAEIGRDTYHAVLSKSDLSHDWRAPEFFLALDSSQAAEAYAKLQAALRTYYGRGARGILMRIGTKLWEPILSNASIVAKAQAALVRGLPKPIKRKLALELLAGLFGMGRGTSRFTPLTCFSLTGPLPPPSGRATMHPSVLSHLD